MGLRGLWADFLVHLIILATLLGVTAARPTPSARVVVLVCGLGLAGYTLGLGEIVGVIVGSAAVALATVLTLAGWVTYWVASARGHLTTRCK